MNTKSSEFSRVAFNSMKFRKMWQTGRQYFTLVSGRFSGKSIKPFFSGKKHNFTKIEETAFANPTLFVFKICIPQDATCCENLRRYHWD